MIFLTVKHKAIEVKLLDPTTLEDLIKPLFYITDTEKRIFWGYLLTSFLLSLWVISKKKPLNKTRITRLLNKNIWLNRSTLLDIQLIFFNNIVWVFCAAPFFGSQIAFALAVRHGLANLFGPGNFITASAVTISLCYSVVLFILDDFSRFMTHYAFHKYPLLWRFHAVHHSASVLTPITLYRVHLIEMLIHACRSILVTGFVGGLFIYAVEGKVSTLQLLGAGIFSLIFNLAGANLRHSHIWLGFGKFEHWIISPAQHQIHHSADSQHYNKNFGVMIALWDRWFATLLLSKNQTVSDTGLGKPIKQDFMSHISGIK